ncbi:MAG: hypothetical protein QMD86_01285 [Patescibacteria group bacterium]|nr:hypothetical protein [Patescibacteria group bacterium]
MEKLLLEFSQTHHVLIYGLIFLGMFIEGEIILIFSGILIKSGGIDFFDTLFISVFAVILHDVVYWSLGKRLSKAKKRKFWFLDLDKIEMLFKKIKEREGLYIFTSKFAWNMNRFVLLSSGYYRTKFKKLISYSIPAAFIWTTTFLSLGYFFAEKTALFKKDIRLAALFITVTLLTIMFAEHIIQKIIKKESKINDDTNI